MTDLRPAILPHIPGTATTPPEQPSEYWRIRLLCRRPMGGIVLGLLLALLLTLTPWQSPSVFAALGSNDTATGQGALNYEQNNAGTTGNDNTADGSAALFSNSSGTDNTAVGD